MEHLLISKDRTERIRSLVFQNCHMTMGALAPSYIRRTTQNSITTSITKHMLMAPMHGFEKIDKARKENADIDMKATLKEIILQYWRAHFCTAFSG